MANAPSLCNRFDSGKTKYKIAQAKTEQGKLSEQEQAEYEWINTFFNSVSLMHQTLPILPCNGKKSLIQDV